MAKIHTLVTLLVLKIVYIQLKTKINVRRLPNTFWLYQHGFKSCKLLKSQKCKRNTLYWHQLSRTRTIGLGLKMFICLSFAFLCMTQRQKQTLNMRMQSPNSLILGSTWQCTLGKLLFKMYLGGSLTICTYLYTSQKAILSLMSFFQKWPEMRKLYHISIFYIYSVICNGMKNFRFFI